MTKVQRYKVGYYSDEWGMSSNTPCLIPADSGYAVKFEDYFKLETELAALKAENESLKWDQWQPIEQLDKRIEQLEDEVAIEKASRKYWEGAYSEWVNTDKAARGLIAKDELIAALKAENETAWAQAHRLALELECLLLDTKDNAIVSKWWDSGMAALDEYQQLKPGAKEEADAWAKMRKAGL